MSEPQSFQCDIFNNFECFRGRYGFHLNSEDLMCPDLPLDARRAVGGTMVMWQTKLEPYIKVLHTDSTSLLPILLSIPGVTISVHIAIYLPTSGKEAEFVTALAALEVCIEQIKEEYSCPIFLRGDCNVNPKNLSRAAIFKHFCSKHSIEALNISHPTYHHFLGNGLYDSQLDVILSCGNSPESESLQKIICKLSNPLIHSHHDMILTELGIPLVEPSKQSSVTLAPKVANDRVKIVWEEESIPQYQYLIADNLSKLRDRWANASSPACISILLSCTNDILSSAAKASNKFVNLGKLVTQKPVDHPEVTEAQKAALHAAKHLRSVVGTPNPDPDILESAKLLAASTKTTLRRISRAVDVEASSNRDRKLFTILQKNPANLYKSIKNMKSNSITQIQKLHVGNKIYNGPLIPDGFFDSLHTLKAPDLSAVHASSSYQSALTDYEHIIKICRNGMKIPDISPIQSMELLFSLRPDVNDLNSITARHFINAGMEGAQHFTFMLNILIKNVNLSSLEELNNVWAMILHKGHGKDRESDRSYRTISTCPFLAKALDKYVGSLYESGWAAAQAETQFQGTGSSHELAALLLTECIQYSIFTAKKPLFVIFLDAKRAFDKIIREFCIRSAYLAGSTDQGLIYLDNRMKHRNTYVEWNKTLMGPIRDKLGVEQGGCNSDRIYKLANNKELILTQDSRLGLDLGAVHCASVGQADDVALVSDDIHRLQCILQLALEYASEYHVEMVPEKTKLLCFTPRGQEIASYYMRVTSPISMSGSKVEFSNEAEHVGILRSTQAGNIANVIARQAAHTRALYGALPAGIARGHHGNPAAALRVEKMYAGPVLLSGLASLVMSKTEIESIDHHFKLSLERLQRLYKGTPTAVVLFMAGSLPASALLHLRQLSLLGMIARLGPQNIVHKHGNFILSSNLTGCRSWFLEIREICQQYSLKDPLHYLSTPPSKSSFKRHTRQHVLDWWNVKLRADVAELPSLSLFRPELPSIPLFRADFMSLSQPHPIWTSAGSSPYEVRKATVQARMLSGRYRTCWLRRHWSGDQSGSCRVPGCLGEPGTLRHLATGECQGLSQALIRATALWKSFLKDNPIIFPVIKHYSLSHPDDFLAFLVDPTTKAPVIALAQLHGTIIIEQLCYLTRTWLFYMHKERLKLMNLW